MNIFSDYANWKFENHDFIYELVKRESKTISRITCVLAVVDYLYEKSLKSETLSEDEELFFSVGYDYIYDNFFTIKTILEFKFGNDYSQLEACAKTINLLLYVNEFQSELSNQSIDSHDLIPLQDFKEKIHTYLDKKENVPDTFFPMLNDIVNPIFEKNGVELNPLESIYYEIAIEYGIYKNNDMDMYQAVFNYQKENAKKK